MLVVLALAVLAGAKKKSTVWKDRRVVVMYRGMHSGSYSGRGRAVTVDANTDKIHGNHKSKMIDDLRASGANVTIAACTYKSKVFKDWLARAEVEKSVILDTKLKGRSMMPNELLVRAYDFVLEEFANYDTLISVRADIEFKKTFGELSSQLVLENRLGFPWKELNGRMSKRCTFRTSGFSPKCEQSWLKNGERFADAVVVAPLGMVDDMRFALTQAMKFKVTWDQHSMFQHLKKQKGYSYLQNTSTMINGYWNSNPNTHSNPLFSLARNKHVQRRRRKKKVGGGGH